jgi:hypothetical protein
MLAVANTDHHYRKCEALAQTISILVIWCLRGMLYDNCWRAIFALHIQNLIFKEGVLGIVGYAQSYSMC